MIVNLYMNICIYIYNISIHMGMSYGFPMTHVYSIWMYHLFRCFYARTELMRT